MFMCTLYATNIKHTALFRIPFVGYFLHFFYYNTFVFYAIAFEVEFFT